MLNVKEGTHFLKTVCETALHPGNIKCLQRRKWWGSLITGGRRKLCKMLALVGDILLFKSRINTRSSERLNGRLAKRALQSVVGDALSLQMFSSSFNIRKDNCTVQEPFFMFFFNGDSFVLPGAAEKLEQMQDGWWNYKQQLKMSQHGIHLSFQNTEHTTIFKHGAT